MHIKNFLNTIILIVKLKDTFTYLQSINKLLDCGDFSFLKFHNTRFENSHSYG